MNIVGYARVSTREQNPDAQEAELRAAGAGRVYVDRGESSRVADRPQWVACLDFLREGDTLVIRALDRIAGSELMAIELIRDLGRRGIRLRSLTEPFLDVDTSTPMGEAIVGIMAEEAARMRAAGMSIAKIARTFGVGASSVSRALAKQDDQDRESAGIPA